MPCVFLKNIPTNFTDQDKFNFCRTESVFQAQQLYTKIAEAAGSDDVEIHLSSENYKLLSKAGYIVACPNVHGFVIWLGKEKRDIKVKQRVADALQYYLNYHGIGKDFDLTFMDMPAGSFFVEQDGKAVMVEGGEYLPSNVSIAQTVYEVLGTETPGVITSD